MLKEDAGKKKDATAPPTSTQETRGAAGSSVRTATGAAPVVAFRGPTSTRRRADAETQSPATTRPTPAASRTRCASPAATRSASTPARTAASTGAHP